MTNPPCCTPLQVFTRLLDLGKLSSFACNHFIGIARSEFCCVFLFLVKHFQTCFSDLTKLCETICLQEILSTSELNIDILNKDLEITTSLLSVLQSARNDLLEVFANVSESQDSYPP